MKIYLSCDMEGTAGIVDWDETEITKPEYYVKWTNQMTKEVAAACEGAVAGGADEILVKDAHDYARNINPDKLPRCAKIFRGWAKSPLSMMAGVDGGFDGAILTGYHSGAGMDSNPLSHTMNTQNMVVKCNGKLMPEAVINAMTAAYFGVPVLCIAGDKGICEYLHSFIPGVQMVSVSEGIGAGSVSLQPDEAVSRITEAAKKAVSGDKKDCLFPLPEHFTIDITFKQHFKAKYASWYPGMTQTDPYSVRFEADDYMDVLTMFHFCL